MNLENIWQEFLKIINEEAGSRIVETWFKAITIYQWESFAKTIYLKAPNTFVKDWVASNYIILLKTHLGRLLNENDLRIIFLDQSKADIQIAPKIVEKTNIISKVQKPTSIKKIPPKCHINPNFTFSSFVVGPTNSLAFAAAQAIAEKPGILYNPLFIYGDSGLGKTHLLHAVANYVSMTSPNLVILYQSADRFVNEFINAIRFDKILAFENKYKNVDLLLIDDIQFISNKEQTQEAFFHIFNTLYESRKQIMFTSDALPGDISGLADRLRSRLDGGLVTDIQAPCLETKIAIIKKKADLHQELLADDVAYYLASCTTSNVRELEGLLIRVIAFACLTKQSITLELAQKVIQRGAKENNKNKVLDLNLIAQKVARFYNFGIQELRSSKRFKAITLARQVAMYFMKKFTDSSLTDIGSYWRRKDHSTVIHAIEKVEEYKKIDQKFQSDLDKIEQTIRN